MNYSVRYITCFSITGRILTLYGAYSLIGEFYMYFFILILLFILLFQVSSSGPEHFQEEHFTKNFELPRFFHTGYRLPPPFPISGQPRSFPGFSGGGDPLCGCIFLLFRIWPDEKRSYQQELFSSLFSAQIH